MLRLHGIGGAHGIPDSSHSNLETLQKRRNACVVERARLAACVSGAAIPNNNDGFCRVLVVSTPHDEFLTVNEAAKILGVSATTVRNWASDGRLDEHRTLGGHRRFRASDVRRLARTVVPQSRPRILIIDDDASIRFVLREAFSSVGFEAVEAESGLLGLDALDQRRLRWCCSTS